MSDDRRHRVLATSVGEMSARSAAARFGIGISTALLSIPSARQGQVSAAKRVDLSAPVSDFHIGMIEASKDISLNQMVLPLEEHRSVSIGYSTPDVWLRKRGLTFGKERTRIGAGAPRPPEAASGLVQRSTDLDPAGSSL